jgi:hypothetical protein
VGFHPNIDSHETELPTSQQINRAPCASTTAEEGHSNPKGAERALQKVRILEK